MSLTVHTDLVQGSEDWLAARRGIVTASVVGQLITVSPASAIVAACPECGAEPGSPCVSRARKEPAPIKTLHSGRMAPADAPKVIEPAANDTSRALTMQLVAERITGWTEETYVSNDMLRGQMDETIARAKYAEYNAPVEEVGFMVRDDWGYPIGFSPDGLVGESGLIEIKSRKPKAQLATILSDQVPLANVAQCQAGLLVSGREWLDYVSFAGGMPLYVKRVLPDQRWFDAIAEAVETFEQNAAAMVAAYERVTPGMPATERTNHFPEIEF